MKKFKNKNTGITLIALVVTIIVLLLLAGITISTLMGENGIITNSQNVKSQSVYAEARERMELAYMAVRSEIATKTAKNGAYNAINDMTNLLSLVKEELNTETNDKWSAGKSEDGEKIIITYRDSKIDQNSIKAGTPRYEGYVNGEITLEEQTASFEFDTVDSTVTPGEPEEPGDETETPEEPIDPEDVETGGATFTRANGQIEIEFLTGTSYTTGNANAPLIDEDEMIPVNWNGTNWVVTDQAGWDYSYGTTDSTKKWANVMLKDTLELNGMTNAQVQGASIADMKGKTVTTEGSMLVWLPRYAYRIVYFDTETNESSYRAGTLTEETGVSNGSIVGYSDARGLVDTTGKTPTGMDTPVTSIAVGEDRLRPHPAFETDLSQGGWSTKLTGIWMGKFDTTEKVNNKITIRPNTTSYTNQTIGTFYTEARDLGIANSHMVKNSEWGAMTYLTESEYGRNGVAVEKNDIGYDVAITTGEGDYKNNLSQSTTGNIYGIYDTVGGAHEFVASYIADDLNTYGNSFTSTNPSASDAKSDKTESTKFATVYAMSEYNYQYDNYITNINKIFGDATIETSTSGSGITSWYSAGSFFIGQGYGGSDPFFARGCSFREVYAGSFAFDYFAGYERSDNSFRVCASVK